MSSFLLTIDVGNTSTSFVLFDLKKKVPTSFFKTTISTVELRNPSALYPRVNKVFPKISQKNIAGVIISSVVPQIDAQLKMLILRLGFPKPIFVTAKTKSRVIIKYKNPKEVGADRLVNARAAIELTKGASIVIDFGTATTFDCVSKKGEYLGGVIAPGPVISAEALYQKTAKLPMVLLEKPAKILGQNTLESIQSGLYHGYRGLVKEIVKQLQKNLGGKVSVLTTGGQAHWILKGTHLLEKNVPLLTHLGLYYYWEDLRVRRKSLTSKD